MFRTVIMISLAAALCGPAFAATDSTSSNLKEDESRIEQPNDGFARVVELVYHPKRINRLKMRVGQFTIIEFPPDENILGAILSDTTFWGYQVTGDRKRLMIRPMESGRSNSATVVTNKNTYLFTLDSQAEGEWYQYVTWRYQPEVPPAYGIFGGDAPQITGLATRSSGEGAGQQVNPDQRSIESGWTIDIARAHFGYDIINKDNAPFAPVKVFDDGTFTYLQLPAVQDMPAIFALDEQGNTRLVDYVVKGTRIMVQRVVPGLLLKLDDAEVKVVRR
jgi:type IV secretion system protein VirB9